MNLLRLKAIVAALPNNIQNGQTADAVPLMADLNHIVNQVNANAQQIGLAALLAAANTFTMVQSGVAAVSAAHFPIATQVQNFVFNTLTSTLGTNTISARSGVLPLSAYPTGAMFTFIPSQTNTGSGVVMAIDALSNIPVGKYGLGSLAASDLVAGKMAVLFKDANTLFLLNPQTLPVPSGTILDFGGTVVPQGFLACDGSNVSRQTNASLFAAIGTTWGVGNGTTTFGVPDFRRRTSIGSGGAGTGTIAATVGSTGGEEGHALTDPENGPHTHVPAFNNVTGIIGGGGFGLGAGGSAGASVDLTIASAGSGTAHNTMQPSAVVLKIIKI